MIVHDLQHILAIPIGVVDVGMTGREGIKMVVDVEQMLDGIMVQAIVFQVVLAMLRYLVMILDVERQMDNLKEIII